MNVYEDFACVVCKRKIKRRRGVCEKCLKRLKKNGIVRCSNCGEEYAITKDNPTEKIHPKAATMFIIDGRGSEKYFFVFSVCRKCDPEFRIEVKVSSSKIN